MRRNSRWYIYPVLIIVLGFAAFIAVRDIDVPTETIEREIPYDKLQK